ncbi:MAG: YbaN family protein [Hyphomicrobiales bacterium]
MFRQRLYLLLGYAMVLLAAAGAVLPLLPTTPFLIVALWAFAKSSPLLAERLRNHPRYGPAIRDWQDQRAIPWRAKLLAVTMMAASGTWLVAFTDINRFVVWSVVGVLCVVATYILTRRSPRR